MANKSPQESDQFPNDSKPPQEVDKSPNDSKSLKLDQSPKSSGVNYFSEDQHDELLAVFQHTKHPSAATRKELAEKLDVSQSRILNWFVQHRRILQITTVHDLYSIADRMIVTAPNKRLALSKLRESIHKVSVSLRASKRNARFVHTTFGSLSPTEARIFKARLQELEANLIRDIEEAQRTEEERQTQSQGGAHMNNAVQAQMRGGGGGKSPERPRKPQYPPGVQQPIAPPESNGTPRASVPLPTGSEDLQRKEMWLEEKRQDLQEEVALLKKQRDEIYREWTKRKDSDPDGPEWKKYLKEIERTVLRKQKVLLEVSEALHQLRTAESVPRWTKISQWFGGTDREEEKDVMASARPVFGLFAPEIHAQGNLTPYPGTEAMPTSNPQFDKTIPDSARSSVRGSDMAAILKQEFEMDRPIAQDKEKTKAGDATSMTRAQTTTPAPPAKTTQRTKPTPPAKPEEAKPEKEKLEDWQLEGLSGDEDYVHIKLFRD